MTNQEAFTTMVQHLRRQGERCVDGGRCLYRNEKGMKCAVGALIPDEAYTEAVEKKSLITLQRESIIPKGLSMDMLRLVQGIHDFYDPWEWENMFIFAAEKFSLEMPEKPENQK